MAARVRSAGGARVRLAGGRACGGLPAGRGGGLVAGRGGGLAVAGRTGGGSYARRGYRRLNSTGPPFISTVPSTCRTGRRSVMRALYASMWWMAAPSGEPKSMRAMATQ